MKVFNEYADYYNILYKEKNYREETGYIESLIQKYSGIKPKDILNIGCGSGNHDIFFSERGYNIDGFDLSEKMIIQAKKLGLPNVNYFTENISTFKSEKKYDCIVSLFHVLSYQITNTEVNKMFSIVRENLKPGGVFVFDCWFGPAVLTDPPVCRVKDFETETELIKRIAVPDMNNIDNYVDVNYTLMVTDKKDKTLREFNETHRMRYFFQPEIELFCEKNFLKLEFCFEWLTNLTPNTNNWNICFGGKVK